MNKPTAVKAASPYDFTLRARVQSTQADHLRAAVDYETSQGRKTSMSDIVRRALDDWLRGYENQRRLEQELTKVSS